ncbi:MAG: TonB-dependent receptor [Roseivirga sp.]|nr:TonB-dependent receptor [Roseivirga sp.]
MRKTFFAILVMLCAAAAFAQQKYTLNGYVRDASNGEELLGVTVYVKELKNGVISNSYGFYSLTLAPGTYTIRYSFIGYEAVEQQVVLDKDISLNISLEEESVELEEVVVTGKAPEENVTSIQMSRNELNIDQVKKLPALFGEPDIIKTIQLLPGVISAGEGTSSFFVRGGSADQNLILIDEAPVYDPSHLFGLFSVFNADIIKDSELYKGGIPARFGGRLSSILDVRTRDGNNKEFEGEAGIGLLASSVSLEGPIKQNESSYLISARRSYVDLFLRAADNDNLVYFYDINAKVNWRANNKNRFFLSLYSGRDDFSFGDDFGFDWGNRTATFRWNHLFNDKLFSNTSLIASNFDYGLESSSAADGFTWDSDLQEYSLKNDLNYYVNPQFELDFGYHFTYRRFAPGEIIPKEGSIFKETRLQNEYALDHAFYLGAQHNLSDKLTFIYGARLSIFQSVGKGDVYLYENDLDNVNPTRVDTLSFGRLEPIKTYVNLEPRVSMRYMLNPQSSVKLSYNRMVQNTHLISSGTVPLPFNTWAPSSYYLKPQLADQVAAGYFRNFKDNTYEVSVEAYYKKMDNVTDFADNAQLFFNTDLATEYRQGEATGYGLEVFVQKKKGDLTGFASYTWSRADRTIDGVNLSRTFLANHDRRHSFNMLATYDYNDKWSFGGSFTYGTGKPTTVPSGSYQWGDGYIADVITERNGYRLPAFHRLDLSATLTPRKNKDKKYETSWVFALYNAYSRQNPFSLYTRVAQNKDGEIIGDGTQKEARMIYLFPLLPSVTYNIKF